MYGQRNDNRSNVATNEKLIGLTLMLKHQVTHALTYNIGAHKAKVHQQSKHQPKQIPQHQTIKSFTCPFTKRMQWRVSIFTVIPNVPGYEFVSDPMICNLNKKNKKKQET